MWIVMYENSYLSMQNTVGNILIHFYLSYHSWYNEANSAETVFGKKKKKESVIQNIPACFSFIIIYAYYNINFSQLHPLPGLNKA